MFLHIVLNGLHLNFIYWRIKTRPHIMKADLKPTMWPQVTWNSAFSCFHTPSVIGMYNGMWFMQCWESNSWPSTLSVEVYPQLPCVIFSRKVMVPQETQYLGQKCDSFYLSGSGEQMSAVPPSCDG